MIADPVLSGTRVIVVGDHEPPIILGEEQIFVPSKIPVITFSIK